MSLDVNADRINKWKCLLCGSKHKKIIKHFRKSDDAQIGYTLFCCNCGHLDHFAWTVAAAKNMCGEENDTIGKSEVVCGIYEKDLVHCPKKNCIYRPGEKPKKQPKTVNTKLAKPPVDIKPDKPKDDVHRINPVYVSDETPRPVPTELHPIPHEHHHHHDPDLRLPGQVGPIYQPPHGDVPHMFGPPDPMKGPEIIMDEPKKRFNPNIIKPDNETSAPTISGSNSTGKL